jgi:hypothetical protein
LWINIRTLRFFSQFGGIMAAAASSLGLLGRRMFGIPQRPDNITPEMNDVAEKIVRLYAEV